MVNKKETRPCVDVKTFEDDYYLKLELSEKVQLPHLNNFFIEILRHKNKMTTFSIFTSREDEGLFDAVLSLKDLRKLQDDILDVIDTVGMGKRLVLGTKYIDLVHFRNDEIGLASGKNKFLLQKNETNKLRAFAAKIID